MTVEKCSNYFGIEEDELKILLKEYALEEQLPHLKYWYNGYRFGNTSSIYNPWSIMKWLSDPNHDFKSHWLNTSSNELVRSLFIQHRETLETDIIRVLSGDSIDIALSEGLHFPALKSDCTKENYFTLLLHAGYLTVTKKEYIREIYKYHLSIPNNEIKIIFKEMINQWLAQIAPNLEPRTTEAIEQALLSGDLKKFHEHFQTVVTQVMSYHDFAKNPDKRAPDRPAPNKRAIENAFHCFTAGFLAWLSHIYIVKSNRESGDGRYDICLIPKNNKYPGYLFELKAYSSIRKIKNIPAATVTKELNKTLKQIDEKNYAADLKEQKVKVVKKVALLFYKKKVWFKEG